MSRELEYKIWYSDKVTTMTSMVYIAGGHYGVGGSWKNIQTGFINQKTSRLNVQDSENYPYKRIKTPGFYILDREVINKEYHEFLNDALYPLCPQVDNLERDMCGVMKQFAWRGRCYPSGRAGFPVMGIRIKDAMTFCEWRTSKTGILHRLPTEEEWEIAYRGKDENLYPWGKDWNQQKWIPVGRHKHVGPDPHFSYGDDITPNKIKHLMGNVKEFVCAKSGNSQTSGCLTVEGFKKGHEPKVCILRGASYCSDYSEAFPFIRRRVPIDYRSYDAGFRYVIPLDDNGKPIRIKIRSPQ